jgi:hypothetical protein
LHDINYNLKEIKFGHDLAGQKLRYKILVHNWRIKSVLYNDGSTIEAIKFEEHVLS